MQTMAELQLGEEEDEEIEQKDEDEQEHEDEQGHNPVWQGQQPQQQGGAWDPWHNQPQQGYNYVPYQESQQLNQRVGEIYHTLQGVNKDVSALTHNFIHFMTHFTDYYQQYPHQPPNNGNN